MLMRHDKNGWHDAPGNEIEAMKKNGWRESSYEEYAAEVAKKTKSKDNPTQSKDETEGDVAKPSGEQPVKRRGRPPMR